MIIAIQPDDYTNPRIGKCDASSPRWAELLQTAGHEVRWVNVTHDNILDQLAGCHGFMWRHIHQSRQRQIARRIMPILRRKLGLVTYPDEPTDWHYDDKIAQTLLFRCHDIPSPRTWVWFDEKAALEWCATAEYPLVLKLWGGAGSSNVRLVENASQAGRWIKRLFGRGVYELSDREWLSKDKWLRIATAAVFRHRRGTPACFWDRHKDYALFQQMLTGNAFDTRVTVIGDRAFAYRRFNRPEDFRASGSGNFSPDPEPIDQRFVRLAFSVARKLNTQSVAIDGLFDGDRPVVCEISYTYVSWMVHDCPGHWTLEGDPDAGTLHWHEGQMWPEEAQIEVFLKQLQAVHG